MAVDRGIAMAENMRFPVIAISKNNSFSVITEVETSCSALGWKKGYFEDLSYFDSSGRLWTVTRTSLSGNMTFIDRLFNRRFALSIEFGEPQENASELAKQLICELIDGDADDLYSQFVSHSELKELIKKSKSPKELISIAETLGAS
jgi:hypothetical protein